MRVTVFTTVLGETDPLRMPSVVNPRVRYVVFADRPLHVPPYDCVLLDRAPGGACLQSREVKIRAHHPALGDPEVVLWHDAAFRLRCDPVWVAAKHLAEDVDLLAFRHPHRTQIEDELHAIVRLGLAPHDVLVAQVAAYRATGFVQTAITSTGFSLRRCTPAVRAFNDAWWSEVARWTYRDQMSVDFCLWRAGLRVRYLPGHYRDNPHAVWTPPRAHLAHHTDLRPSGRVRAPGTVDPRADADAGRVDRERRGPDAGDVDVRADTPPRTDATGSGEFRGEPVASTPGGVR